MPEIGGSELAIKNITDRLPEIHFDLITSRPSKKLPAFERISNVNVYRVGNRLGLSYFLLPKNFFPIAVFLKACELTRKGGSYGIVHAYQASQAAGGAWLLKWFYPRTSFLLTVQEGKALDQQSWLLRLFRRIIFKKVNGATAISSYLAEYVKTQNQKIPILVIPNGVDLEKFKTQSSNLKITDKKEKIIITVSRLVKKNGVGDLVDAFYILHTKYHIPNAKLLIVGDGPLAESLKLKVKNLKLEDGVIFLGSISYEEIPDYLAQADVFVRPSLSEGLGNAFLEAMAAGIPIIGTSVGGIPDFIVDGETGLFCKSNDPKDVASKIHMVLSDEDLRNNLVFNGRKLVEKKYNWDKIAEQFERIYTAKQLSNITI